MTANQICMHIEDGATLQRSPKGQWFLIHKSGFAELVTSAVKSGINRGLLTSEGVITEAGKGAARRSKEYAATQVAR